MPSYQTSEVLRNADAHTVAVLVLCALALTGNYLFWIENLVRGFLCHDATYVAKYLDSADGGAACDSAGGFE